MDHKALNEYYRLIGQSASATELPSRTGDIETIIEKYSEAISAVEEKMWEGSLTEWITLYHHLYQEKETLYTTPGHDNRYHITIIIPVADRPMHLGACLNSLLKLCTTFHYGGISDNQYNKVSVIIADDSEQQVNIQKHQQLVGYFSKQGLDISYFGLTEQLQLLDTVETDSTASILGAVDKSFFYHKGPSIMRNIAYLKLNEQRQKKQLFYFIDSDQEFRVKIQTLQGEQDLYAINYFAELDKIFNQQDVRVLTGKVVGDPPVSPAVMAGNFLEDVISFLQDMATQRGPDNCRFHGASEGQAGDAAYHDMAELFGFELSRTAYPYRCDLADEHDHQRCFHEFARKLNQFFYGEHPTRKSFFEYAGKDLDVKPARTIYTGNYVFNAAGLRYFVPFAGLKLRMAGPVLGRVIKAEIGAEFVSANLPMLHKRTLEQTGQSEFRSGVIQQEHRLDLAAEFERQYYGDVMLFSMEKLTHTGYPESLSNKGLVKEIVESTELTINQQYMAKHEEIMHKLSLLEALYHDGDNWWNQVHGMAETRQNFDGFICNIKHNYSSDSHAHRLVNSADNRIRRVTEIVNAIHAYPADREIWEDVLAGEVDQA